MKATQLITLSLLLGGALALLGGCNNSTTTLTPNAEAGILEDSSYPVDITGAIDDIKPGDLTGADAASLIFMREEEKLARDTYLTLNETFELRVFANIAVSEQRHMDSLALLLERYDLADPVGENGIGTFVNEDLQQLYDSLIADGTESQSAALLVGLAIEEIDIQDLRKEIESTELADIQLVYNNLLAGSYNHLRAFARNYEATTGETYAPHYLDQEDYDTILAASNSRGHGHGRR